jgi:hypothetical protein
MSELNFTQLQTLNETMKTVFMEAILLHLFLKHTYSV